MQHYRTNRTPIESAKAAITDKSTEKKIHSIRKALLEALAQVSRDQSISFSPVDSWVYLLAIPSTFRYSLEETRQIAKEIQHTILPPKKPRSLFQIVTWAEIINHQHKESPTYKQWYRGDAHPFEDGSQFVFFIDTEHTKKLALKMLKPSSFAVIYDEDLSSLHVSDGHLEQVVPYMDLAEKAIWSARDLSEVVGQWVDSLEGTFRLSAALLKALKSTFKDARFLVEERKLYVDSPAVKGELNYQKMVKSIQFSRLSPGDWVKRITLEDLIAFDVPSVTSIRSEAFSRVRPEALSIKQEGHVLVAEREVADRLVAIKNIEEQNEERIQHFIMEDKRLLSRRHFNAHSFCHDDTHSFTMAIVGDQVASILAHPELVLGALLTSFAAAKTVRLIAVSEDIAVIAHENAPWSTIEEVIRRAHALLLCLSPDGSDALFLDKKIDLPEHGCGVFSFVPIPAPYFDLMETSYDATLALPPGRCHYLRGLAFELIREWTLAEQEFRRAFSADSTDGDIAHALGRALGETGRHREALQFLKKATVAVPDDPEIANTYGLALLKCNHPDLASRSFERAVELAPDDPHFLANLGQSYFMSQRIKDAEHILSKALEHAPSFSDAHSTLAQIKWRQGDIIGARRHARKAFAANPSNKGVQDLLWALTVDETK